VASKHDDEAALSERERSNLQRRDRKRRTDMVVDNAGVKRLRRAISERQRERAKPSQETGG